MIDSLFTVLLSADETDGQFGVFTMGRGWRSGTREVFVPTWWDWRATPIQRLVAAGFAVASIDYRLSGETPPTPRRSSTPQCGSSGASPNDETATTT